MESNSVQTHDHPEAYTAEELREMDWEAVLHLDPERLAVTPAVEVAHLLERLELDQKRHVLRLIPESLAAKIVSELRLEDSAELIGVMRQERAVQILDYLDPDDATDLIAELAADDQDRLLKDLDPKHARTVRTLLSYGEDSAGGIMTTEVATVSASMKVDDAIARIRVLNEQLETIYYIYVVDDDLTLKGVISMRDIILARPGTTVGEIMKADLNGCVTPETDREKVAMLMAEYNLLALPVVDNRGHLLGIVTHDDVVDVIREEATEDFQKIVGAGGDESAHSKFFYSFRRRHPWLQVNLATAFLAAAVVYHFQPQIQQLTLLAVFMPIIAGMGGNSGAQTLAVAIRSLALGEVRAEDSWRLCLKEGSLAALNGLLTGLVAAAIALLLGSGYMVGLVVVIAMVLNMALAGLSGAFIPLFLQRLGLDPAQSSSIFLTTVTDVAGFFIFLSLGSWLLLH